MLPPLAGLKAMLGDFDEARRLLAEANAILADFGVTLGAKAHSEALVAMLAGDPSEAERCLRADYEERTRMGEKGFLSTTAALLARAVEAQGRHDEAEELTEVAQRTGASDDLSTQIVWRGVRARVLAERGLAPDAETLAREAVRLAEQTDRLNHHADALVDLAAVLRTSGRADESEALDAALVLYERKGNVVAGAKVRERLTALDQATSARTSGRRALMRSGRRGPLASRNRLVLRGAAAPLRLDFSVTTLCHCHDLMPSGPALTAVAYAMRRTRRSLSSVAGAYRATRRPSGRLARLKRWISVALGDDALLVHDDDMEREVEVLETAPTAPPLRRFCCRSRGSARRRIARRSQPFTAPPSMEPHPLTLQRRLPGAAGSVPARHFGD